MHNPTQHSPYIFDCDTDNFQQRVIAASATQPVLVDFSADWCGPCRILAPVLHRLIPEYNGKVLLANIDADENMKLCGHYRLRGFPTVILFVNGEEIARFSGARSVVETRHFIDEHLQAK
ncbi:MAG: thioredoxin [Gammaproteobacteria bacterium]|nr:thioredoxin [Gammaproteobacteria bacterium]